MAAIGTLSSGIAHDFKNMLAGIQGNVEILRHQLAPHSPHQKRLDIISQIVQRGTKLSGQLLGYARGGQTDISPIDLSHLVAESLEMFGHANRNIGIETHLNPDTPVINGDRNQIEQVLLNLLINAVQAMPTGGRLFIETKATDILDRASREYNVVPGRYAKLSVRDTGHGMDRETQRQIFEPFFTTKPESQGTGLGLASTYGIIKNHKGYIDVSSQPGKGSCFSLLLPAARAATLPKAVAPTPERRDTSDTILLIDDEPDFLDVGREMLLLLGYQVITATHVDEALARLKEANGRLYTVILDMVMPGPGVETTLSRIVRIAPTVPLLLSSGFNRESESIRQLLTRCHGFIPKPYRLAELSKAIRDARDILQAQSENRS
ncbi:ATP-binding protein [Desulfosarcina cetonica]|uniref:ATP-binding protein n=1 Tax=Desulfosarcina cetonica TaxID=90730 RepID=UPI0006CFD6F7|nr:ATP-binding protein [Desulfosarcina cetonica]